MRETEPEGHYTVNH